MKKLDKMEKEKVVLKKICSSVVFVEFCPSYKAFTKNEK